MKKLFVGLAILCFVHLLNIAGFAADGDPVLEGKLATGNIATTGQLGAGAAPSYPVDVTMTATDVRGLYIDGVTNDYTGAGIGITALFQRDVNRGNGVISDYAGWQSYLTLKHTGAVIEGDKFAYGAITRIQNDTAGLTIEDANDRQYWEVGVHSTVKNEGDFDTDSTGKFSTRFIGYYSYVWADTYDVYDTSTGSPANVFSASGLDVKVEHVPTLQGTATGTFNSYGVYIEEVSGDAAGTSSAYGIYIADAVSGADTNYAIYSADADLSYLAGSLTALGDLNLGADDDIAHAYIHDAGTLVFNDDSDDTTVTLGPVADGTTNLGITGGLTISAASSITAGDFTLTNGNLVPSTAGKGIDYTAVVNGVIKSFNLITGGTGYTTGALVITGGGGTGAAGTFTATVGIIDSITLTDGGSGYTSMPTVDGDAGGNADAVIVPGVGIMTSELLADYEQGTFVSAVTCSTSGSYTINASYDTLAYIKVGNKVTVQGYLQIDSENTPVGNIHFALPFTAAALLENADNATGVAALTNHGGNLPNGVIPFLSSGQAYFRLRNVADDGTAIVIDKDDVDTAWTLSVSITYITE
jgi:hypothetical protein